MRQRIENHFPCLLVQIHLIGRMHVLRLEFKGGPFIVSDHLGVWYLCLEECHMHLPFSVSNVDNNLCCAVDVCFQNWAQVLLVRVWFFFLINSYFSKILSFGPTLPSWVVNGGSVDFSGTAEVMALWRLEPKGGLSTLVTFVVGAYFSPVGPGTDIVLGLLVCS
jgi:hypothetical protein